MINFISNMVDSSSVNGEGTTARKLIDQWIEDRDLDEESAEDFLNSFKVSNVNTNAEVTAGSLDTPLLDGQTLAVYTKEVATGGSKGA